MRKIIMAAAAVATLAMPTAALANAGHPSGASGTGAGVSEIGWIGDNPGNSAQYGSSYTDPVFGAVTCTGVHLKKQNTDNFTCTTTQPGGFSNTPYVSESVSWNSDYWGIESPNGPGAVKNTTMHITAVGYDANGHVTSYTGTASY